MWSLVINVYGTRSRTSGTYGAMFGTLKQKIKITFQVVGDEIKKIYICYR